MRRKNYFLILISLILLLGFITTAKMSVNINTLHGPYIDGNDQFPQLPDRNEGSSGIPNFNRQHTQLPDLATTNILGTNYN